MCVLVIPIGITSACILATVLKTVQYFGSSFKNCSVFWQRIGSCWKQYLRSGLEAVGNSISATVLTVQYLGNSFFTAQYEFGFVTNETYSPLPFFLL